MAIFFLRRGGGAGQRGEAVIVVKRVKQRDGSQMKH